MSAEQTKFDWRASDSAPQYYAMKIINGTLYYHGDTNGAGLYVPNGGVISHGWGRMNSTHVTGEILKPLPDKLEITFFSYLEDQFYRGVFDLPYDTILRLFQEAEAGEKRKDGKGNDLPNYYVIIVGVAPGGTVAVWLRNQGTTEVFFGQAQKVELDFAKYVFPATTKEARTAQVKKVSERESNPEVLASIRKNGIPFSKWLDYRRRYNWIPTFAVANPPNDFSTSFYTGESERFQFPLDKMSTTKPLPMPKATRFSYAVNGVENYYILQFNEEEILDAFSVLTAKKSPMFLEFDPKFPKDQTLIRLHNGKESIPLTRYTVERI